MCQVITHTAEKRFIFVENRAGDYRTQLESSVEEAHEDLMQESAMAIVCFDFADLVVQGNCLFESINSLDNDWRNLVYTGAVTYSEFFENRIKKLYERWLEVSRRVVAFYNKIEGEFAARGFDASPIHELRKAIREVEGMVTDDITFFRSPKLIDLRDAAIDDLHNNTDLEYPAGAVQ